MIRHFFPSGFSADEMTLVFEDLYINTAAFILVTSGDGLAQPDSSGSLAKRIELS